ncbi:MAG: indole-3-glycerol phosphate synthase TrpC [Anaerolineaceae bacterium]|nr:indole-3-glycerol phosphate synthase TrpC [Anaerolineaceae bacterium]
MFVKTDTILDQILAQKQDEIRLAQAEPDALAKLEQEAYRAPSPRDFKGALQRSTVALIAEVKKASPSKGLLVENFNPVRIARTYEENGAAAISVLTDVKFFQGNLDDLRAVRAAVRVPVLRKDFIIDAHQVYEARMAGADAALLIVMALEDGQLRDLHSLITELGMSALVEVHNEAELERALAIGASLIGVNNRDLRTFHEDLETTARVAALVPHDVTLVAESAIRSAEDVQRMGTYGARAVLVGEGLVKAKDMAGEVRRYSSQQRNPIAQTVGQE